MLIPGIDEGAEFGGDIFMTSDSNWKDVSTLFCLGRDKTIVGYTIDYKRVLPNPTPRHFGPP